MHINQIYYGTKFYRQRWTKWRGQAYRGSKTSKHKNIALNGFTANRLYTEPQESSPYSYILFIQGQF
jgi:hypothetical protein